MKKGTPLTTYQLTFIPRGKDIVVDRAEASEFAEKLHAEFRCVGNVEKNLINNKQYLVYLPVKFESIRKIVAFMQKDGFGRAVAERWWLNAVESFEPWRMVTGINIARIPVSTWIGKFPKP